jgi:hypothetical protein
LKTKLLAALALAAATAVTLPAMARENPQDFPMPAATFQRHVDKRIQRANARMETDIREGNLTDAQAKEVRAHFNTVAAEVVRETQKVSADGKVTLEGAREVRAVARQLWRHRGHRQQGEDV